MPLQNEQASNARMNWSGNYQYKAPYLHQPKTVEEVQHLVKDAGKQKALGSCHCFNDIADSPYSQLSTRRLNKMLGIDKTANTVTVEAGITYGRLAPLLHQEGYALHNLASLPHISVSGACATATHGSGINNANLASVVTALQFVSADGDLVNLSREKDAGVFNGAVVSLGALGIITALTLYIEATFMVRQDLFQQLPLQSLKDHWKEILSAGYSVSLFTDWQHQLVSQVWIKRRIADDNSSLGPDFFGAKAAIQNLHPITRLAAENCTGQMGVPGVWYERLPHFKMGFTPSSGEELQSEFFIPRENALDAILAIEKKGHLIFPHLMISEIRTIAADECWMSPCYQLDCIAIHFTWKQHTEAVMNLLIIIEQELEPFNYRPHWGKLFTMAPALLHRRYDKLPEFMQLLKEYDPQQKFSNAFLDRNIYSCLKR